MHRPSFPPSLLSAQLARKEEEEEVKKKKEEREERRLWLGILEKKQPIEPARKTPIMKTPFL